MTDVATSARSRAPVILARLSFVAWVCALILIVNRTFEWTYPYCNVQDDGPTKPAYGFPLPYLQESAALSMSPDIMLVALLLNIVLLAALAYPIMGWAVRWLSAAGTIAGVLIATVGVLLALMAGMVVSFEFALGGSAVSSIAPPGDRYWAYRPVGMFENTYYDCAPSEFWFGPIKNPAALAKKPN